MDCDPPVSISKIWNDPITAWPELCLTVVEAGSRNVDATLQSALILGRGLRALDMTYRGLVCLTIEQEGVAARARVDAGGPCSATREEIRTLPRRWSRQVGCAMMLLSTATQVLEEAAFPVLRRSGDVIGGAPDLAA